MKFPADEEMLLAFFARRTGAWLYPVVVSSQYEIGQDAATDPAGTVVAPVLGLLLKVSAAQCVVPAHTFCAYRSLYMVSTPSIQVDEKWL